MRKTPVEEKLAMADAFFGGGHELIVARRHFVEGADPRQSTRLVGHDDAGGALPVLPLHHRRAARHLPVEPLRALRRQCSRTGWSRPAPHSTTCTSSWWRSTSAACPNDWRFAWCGTTPTSTTRQAVNFAAYRNLVFAENDHAIAFADFGHRFPTIEIYSKSERSQPWNHSEEELRGVSDLVHACHAAMGPGIPCNEEWYYKPPDADVPMPWQMLIKWRISNPAGFEGGTMIYVNTIDPDSLRDKVVPRLFELKGEGRIAPMKIAFECDCVPNCLKYNPAVRLQHTREAEFPPLSVDARGKG